MKVRDVMIRPAVCVEPGQSVASAAKVLERYHVGALPVCDRDGSIRGIVTDRDIVVRCLAPEKDPVKTKVDQIMSSEVICASPEMDTAVAAHLMGRKRVRRLPVVKGGKVQGLLSLDLLAATEQNAYDAADALGEISAYFLEKSP